MKTGKHRYFKKHHQCLELRNPGSLLGALGYVSVIFTTQTEIALCRLRPSPALAPTSSCLWGHQGSGQRQPGSMVRASSPRTGLKTRLLQPLSGCSLPPTPDRAAATLRQTPQVRARAGRRVPTDFTWGHKGPSSRVACPTVMCLEGRIPPAQPSVPDGPQWLRRGVRSGCGPRGGGGPGDTCSHTAGFGASRCRTRWRGVGCQLGRAATCHSAY